MVLPVTSLSVTDDVTGNGSYVSALYGSGDEVVAVAVVQAVECGH